MHKIETEQDISNNLPKIQTRELVGSAQFRLPHSNIVFDGRYYRYKQYRYDLLADAIKYAQADAARPASQQEPEISPQWVEVEQPTEAELQTMADLNITFDDKYYRYGEYRYECFADAINYAKWNWQVQS